MKTIDVQTQSTLTYYRALLQRYVRRLIHDEIQAAILVKKVLDKACISNSIVPSKRLRNILKFDLLNHCYYWQQAQILFRPPVCLPRYKKQLYVVKNKSIHLNN